MTDLIQRNPAIGYSYTSAYHSEMVMVHKAADAGKPRRRVGGLCAIDALEFTADRTLLTRRRHPYPKIITCAAFGDLFRQIAATPDR
jgi:hypothetical protein